MTRTEYLTQLELYLKKLPEADQIEAMDYFRELFDDAGVEGEEELITSLGTPKEAAHEVLSNLLDKKINEAPAQKNNRQILPCGRCDCHSGFLCGFHTWYHRRIPIFS